MLTGKNSAAGEMLAQQIPIVLRAALGSHWEFSISANCIDICHPKRGVPYRPPRRRPSWKDLLDSLETSFAGQGAPRDACLPLRWGKETELTISAVQALDPLLKDGTPGAYRSGFLAQPVVRFTGKRDTEGHLKDGFLTAFVNVSRVQPVGSLDDYGRILDGWLTTLSDLGFHARHLRIHGMPRSWRRRQVEGITLRFSHLDIPLGDIVLLWHADHPERLAVDLGTGLERLAWARTQERWHDLVYGRFVHAASPETLDAIRTATLLLGSGIMPSARGTGGITRRVVRGVDRQSISLGASAFVRNAHSYWSLFGSLRVSWPEVAQALEGEALR